MLAPLSIPLAGWMSRFRPQPMSLGQRGERYAARWLKRRGYKIVAGGRRSRYGEVDLIAVDGQTIVFVEVKTRRSAVRGEPAEAVNAEKQRRLVRCALAFLKEHHLLEYRARFDVIAVVWPPDARRPALQHFPNAFQPTDLGQFFS